jgi:hypothetical protein
LTPAKRIWFSTMSMSLPRREVRGSREQAWRRTRRAVRGSRAQAWTPHAPRCLRFSSTSMDVPRAGLCACPRFSSEYGRRPRRAVCGSQSHARAGLCACPWFSSASMARRAVRSSRAREWMAPVSESQHGPPRRASCARPCRRPSLPSTMLPMRMKQLSSNTAL